LSLTDTPTAETRSESNVSNDRRRGIANLRRHTANGMLINGAFQVGLVGVSALRGLIVAAFLTRSDYGVWGLVGVTMWTAAGLKTVFGANDKYVQQSDENQEHAFQRAFTIELIFAAIIAPIAAGIVAAYAALTGKSEVLAPGLTLLLLLPSTALQFPLAVYYRRMDFKRQRMLGAIDPVATAVVTLTLAILGAGYWSFVGGALTGSWSAAAFALRSCPFPLRLRYDRGTIGEYVRFSLPLVVSGLAVIALFQVITLIGVGPLGLAGIGTFTLVGNLVQFTDQADDIITDTLYPAVCAVRDRIELLSEIFVKSNRLSLMWAVPFGIGTALFGSDLARFALGSQWIPAVPLLEIMGVVTAIHHVGYNWSAFVKARGITWPMAVSAVVVSISVIGSGIPLMYSDHLVGLGYAFAIGECVALLTRAFWLSRFFHGVSILMQLLRAFTPTVLAAVPVLLLRFFTGPERTLLAAAGVFALYALMTVIFTVLLERQLLQEAAGYMVGRRRRSADATQNGAPPAEFIPAVTE
jgi:O-antigen/teichoic acid export membrane protein